MVNDLRLKYPGLLIEKNRNGSPRYRVRIEGQKAKRITLNVAPDHPNFSEHYYAARSGVQMPPPEVIDAPIAHTIAWLVVRYQAALDQAQQAGRLQSSTVDYRKRHTDALRAAYGEYRADMPTHKLIELRDTMQDRPGTADTFIKSIRSMYKWGVERGLVASNPAIGISNISTKAQGAVPWSVEDLHRFKQKHPPGSPGHLCLTVFMFTAARIGDAVQLGRGHEFVRQGQPWLGWQPEKANSPLVRIPMAPPLITATRASKVVGPSYILTAHGKPHASKKALSNRLAKFCEQAGLKDRSAHGIRKAAGYLMAEHGLSQYAIMAIHGHAEAKTSEIYTRGVDRDKLAVEAMAELQKVDW